jgi:hypothetical protein
MNKPSVCLLLSAVLLTACQSPDGNAAPAAASTAGSQQPAPSPAASHQPPHAERVPVPANALRDTLVLLAEAKPPAWDRVRAISALGAFSPGAGYGIYTSSITADWTLAGFGKVALPDGNVGADAGTRDGNEGEARLTLVGTDDSMRVVVVKKFYPRTDYARVLHNQLRPEDRLVRADGNCDVTAHGDASKPTDYWIALQGAAMPLAVTASQEEGGNAGPGYTVFEFRRGGLVRTSPVPSCNGA